MSKDHREFEVEVENKEVSHYRDYNAQVNILKEDGSLNLDADKEAARQYFLQDINQNTTYFHNLKEKVNFLIGEGYYEEEVLDQYDFEFIKSIFKKAYGAKFRFQSFMGAYKFYTSYALKNFDGTRYLERFEDRVAMNALYLARGDNELAETFVDEMISGRYQPATPTFLNAGKKQRGEMVSCFLLRVEDNMESISRSITSALQLSKRGGGVAFNLTNIRETGAPIKKIKNQSSGIIPVMKMLEDAFSYANQLGSRQGAGAVYLNVHHPDIYQFLDTKRENSDEKIRIKTLSIGLVIPDITFDLIKKKEDMYLFSPYDVERKYGVPFSDIDVTEKYYEMVEDPSIRKKKIDPKELFQTIAELQFESGYPYIMNEGNVNRENPIEGRVTMSNLCVTGDTKILTENGYRNVKELWETQEDFQVTVDNRARFLDFNKKGLATVPSTRMFKTGEDQPVFKVTTSEGYELKATDYHKFAVLDEDKNVVMVPLKDLKKGDLLLVQPDGENGVFHDSFDSIESISFDSVQDVYDVTVEDGHSVIFDGITTHQCSEILQVSSPSTYNSDGSYATIGKDISCNLGSLNIVKAFDSPDFSKTVESAIRALTTVTYLSDISSVPSIDKGNSESHAIGLGQMNLHGFLGRERIHYDSPEAVDFTNIYFLSVLYEVLKASNKIARETGVRFGNFENSKYADGSFFDKYLDKDWSIIQTDKVKELMGRTTIHIPTQNDWRALRDSVMKHGLYHQNLQAVPPTGSISYINHSTSSVHPITSKVEIRKEGKLGRVYYPAPHMDETNLEYFKDAYELGTEAIINVYAAAQEHIDQGMSMTLFYDETATTRDVIRSIFKAKSKGIKTIYYSRIRQAALKGTEVAGLATVISSTKEPVELKERYSDTPKDSPVPVIQAGAPGPLISQESIEEMIKRQEVAARREEAMKGSEAEMSGMRVVSPVLSPAPVSGLTLSEEFTTNEGDDECESCML